jgi:hypothetical protein
MQPVADPSVTAEEAGAPRPRRRNVGGFVGAAVAAAVSLGLVYWIAAGQDLSLQTASPPDQSLQTARPPPVAAPRARPEADAGQVVRAYETLQQTYAEQGLSGVIAASRTCASGLKTDPAGLDFCLAFDGYAAALQPGDAAQRTWRAEANARQAAMARDALPAGADVDGHLEQVRVLARQAIVANSLAEPTPATPPPVIQSPVVRRAAVVKSKPTGAATKVAAVKRVAKTKVTAVKKKAAVHARSTPCRLRSTPAQRMVCASPALARADAHMRSAYRRAATAGVSPSLLARDQARFRTALNAAPDRAAAARLYKRRTQALQQQARRAR